MLASDPETQFGHDTALLHSAVREAGALAVGFFRADNRVWNKDDGSPVSEADLAVDKLLRDRLCTARPDYGWLSEETQDTADRLRERHVWIVDPIDGTKSFLKGTENWCISAALVEYGRPVLGAVYLPLSDQLYAAQLRGGAFLNDEPIKVSRRTNLPGSRVIAHRSILNADRWQRSWPPIEVGMTTSLALRLCYVADGSYDATLALGSKSDWDLAAGDLIVHEAGGSVSNLDGAQLLYNQPHTRHAGLVACSRTLKSELMQFTRGYKGH